MQSFFKVINDHLGVDLQHGHHKMNRLLQITSCDYKTLQM
jgi:hypothetical protein